VSDGRVPPPPCVFLLTEGRVKENRTLRPFARPLPNERELGSVVIRVATRTGGARAAWATLRPVVRGELDERHFRPPRPDRRL
jgi:hypothetical protein